MVINGNNIELLKSYPDNYFDSIVTDPPYGLGKEPDANELMKDWIAQGYHEIEGKGFMGKEWDAFVPQPIFWKEVFRVLKPGGHIVAFYGTRTYDWGVMAMRFAGFEIRDCIQWIYGSGFPKSHNIGKAVDKLQGKEVFIGKGFNVAGQNVGLNQNKELRSDHPNYVKPIYQNKWDGWGSALKPANEPIVLARKPLEKGLSIAENVLKWGVGGINIDGCRVSGVNMTKGGCKFNSAFFKSGESNFTKDFDDSKGRFPANIILGCNCEDENNHIEDCPIKIMDEQSGVLNKQGISKTDNKSGWQNQYVGGDEVKPIERKLYLDVGGASRFFYCAKASKSERNKGLEGFEEKQSVGGGGGIGDYLEDVNSASGKYGSEKAIGKNFHPTVKPVKLMQYLVRLITPPNGRVLDPFCGSGTTGVACKLEGFEFVGMEQDAEYCKIAESRIKNNVKKQSTLW